jgi:hypothetical protein
MPRYIEDERLPHRVTLIHSNRNPDSKLEQAGVDSARITTDSFSGY